MSWRKSMIETVAISIALLFALFAITYAAYELMYE